MNLQYVHPRISLFHINQSSILITFFISIQRYVLNNFFCEILYTGQMTVNLDIVNKTQLPSNFTKYHALI